MLMLSSPEEEVLAKACDALYKFASKGGSFCSELYVYFDSSSQHISFVALTS